MIHALLMLALAAQQTGDVSFKATTQLVVEAVAVKDKNGNAIEGLTAKDFIVTEDGAPQTIRVFDYQKLGAAGVLPPVTQMVAAFPKLTRTQIMGELPGNGKYKNRRLIALYFDLTAMRPPEQLRAFDNAIHFVRTKLTADDLVAIMTFEGGAVQVLHDFTGDRARLEGVLKTLIVGEDQDAAAEASGADTGTAFGQDDGEFNIFTTDRQLAALQTAANMLGRLSEKKSLIYFASGLRLNGSDNQAQLTATINAAVRSGVAVWPIDARGLTAEAPMGDATRGSPGGAGMYTGASARDMAASFRRSQDALWSVAADTGGKAMLDSNDLAAGMVRAQTSIESYYVIGYYTTNEKLDGKFRRVKISLANNLAANLEYRQGYFAGKVFGKFTVADKERQLEDALMLGDPITELTIALEVNYFQLNRAEYFVPLTVKIPGSELARARRGGNEHTRIDFIGEVKDSFGTTIQNVRDKVDVKLTGATAAELARRPIEYDTGFTLLPGKYQVKFLARDAETGRIGTYLSKFTIPNLNKEDKRIAMSSVVLSSQRMDIRDTLVNAAKDKGKSDLANPLVQDGMKLIPSVTRVFRRDRELFVYLQAYRPEAVNPGPLLAFVTFYRGGEKAFETAPTRVADTMDNRLKTAPLRFNLPLKQLPPGEYECQVTVLDGGASKAAFSRTRMMVIE